MSRRIPRAVSMHMAQNAFARCAEKVNTRKNLTLNRQAVGEVVSYCTMIAANDTLDFDRDKQERLCTEMNHRAEVYTVEMSAYGQPKAREKLRERTAPIWISRLSSRRDNTRANSVKKTRWPNGVPLVIS